MNRTIAFFSVAAVTASAALSATGASASVAGRNLTASLPLFGLTVNGDDIACASGEGWTFDGATVSLAGAGPFVLSTDGVSFTSNVAVVAQSDCAVTFSNLEVFAGNHAGLSPFTVSPGVSVALRLDGNTVLKAGAGAAAITVVSNETGVASLTIDADATDTLHTLGATGGNQGAGIGGGDGETCGSVTINGGVVSATGGANAAGIGGGRNGAGGTVTISGGRLDVKSAGAYAFVGGKLISTNGGAAIGGGYNGEGGITAISGGTVSLTGAAGGAAVGPGKDGAGGTTAITGGSILALVGAVEPTPSNGVARVWPVAVSNLTAGAAAELPWLPATYGTNDLVATMGGGVCVWLPTGDYAYGEPESDGAGGWRRHAVIVDAEGNVTLDGWVADPAVAGLLYSNNFKTRRTLDVTPSGRWMEAAYVSGKLVRPVSSISENGREPYNNSTEYQDAWTMKTGYCRTEVTFTVADDGGNMGALVNASKSVNSATVAMQPFYNEFTTGVLKVSVDIRTPSQTDSFTSSAIACATLAPIYKSALEVSASAFPAPMRFGPANLQDTNKVWRLCAATRGRETANSPGGSYFGQNDSRNAIASGSWVRYMAEINLDAGTYTATFTDLGTEHPTPDTAGDSRVDFRQSEGDANSTTFAFLDPLTPATGGIAGLAFYVQGITNAADTDDAPMFDNIAVYWKASGEGKDYAPVYENDFSTRRYRQVEPAGSNIGSYVPVLTTNVVQSSFYGRGTGTTDFGSSDRRLVPDGAPYLGQDGWRRIAGDAPFAMVYPNNNGGYGWNNKSVLRATGSGETGMVAVPLGTTVTSGKVRLSCDILMGALTNSTSQTRDIAAAAFLAGNGAFTNAWYDASVIRAADIATALRDKGVCGAGTCRPDMEGDAYTTNTWIYSFNGSGYSSQDPGSDEGGSFYSGEWGRFIVTLDLDAGTYDLSVYDIGSVGQTMDYTTSSGKELVSTNGLALAASAVRNVDSVVLFSDGQDSCRSNNKYTDTYHGKRLGRFPLFDNVRVCLVNDDGTDGTELYACNFEYGYRLSVQNAASLAAHSDREGADRWIRRGNTYGTINAVDAGGGDNVVILDGFGLNGDETRAGYAVQPFGAVTKGLDSVNFAADIRPPERFADSSGCYAYVEVGGDAYAQGVYRPKTSSSWRVEPRIGFGFSVGAGKDDVGLYTNVLISVQTNTATSATASSTNANYVIDKSHWYRFRVTADQTNETFAVKVYDQGAAKPLASDADGTLVATFEDLDLPDFGENGMTTFGLAGAGFASTFGSLDDPGVVLVDNLAAFVQPVVQVEYADPEGRVIEDLALVEWLLENDFTQADINALGNDTAATDKLYECWLLNCSIKAENPGGAIRITGFAVSNDVVSVTVQLERQSPFGFITGVLNLHGTDDLANDFGLIDGSRLDFGDGDPIFDTASTSGSVTQTVTVTFDNSFNPEKFFKAKIEFPILEEPEEPWEDTEEEPEE